VGRKEVAHRAARARFDFMVGVDEGNPQRLDRCRPTVDFPEPGRPTNATILLLDSISS
jgi:hypothetical protein